MWFAAEKAVKRGHTALLHGHPQRARELFESALQRRSDSVEALYPLARAYAELGRTDDALEALERVGSKGNERVTDLFRALILYDVGRLVDAREALEGVVAARNPLGETLAQLIEFETTAAATSLKVSRGTYWNASAVGRILALFDARLHSAGGRSAALDVHFRFLSAPDLEAEIRGDDAAASAAAAKTASDSAPSSAKSVSPDPASKAEWQTAVDAAFFAGEHARVEQLHGFKGADETWRTPRLELLAAFSLMVRGRDGKATSVLEKLGDAVAAESWLHYLRALAATGAGDRCRAIANYARAFALDDYTFHPLLRLLAKRLDVTIELVDE